MKPKIHEILLAEDDRMTAHMIKIQLERLGFHVTLASNGREALGIIHTRPVDLLITDVVLPEMDGVDLYLELKKNVATESLPIIISTDKQMFLDSFAALGVSHFIAKSSNIEALLVKIREIGDVRADTKTYRKVLICGDQNDILTMMTDLLQSRGCLVTTADGPVDIVSKALVMIPHIIIMYLLIDGKITTDEIIRSLRCYRCLKDSAIATYIQISSEQCGQLQSVQGLLADHIGVCQQAGANKFLGRFNRLIFLNELKEFGVS